MANIEHVQILAEGAFAWNDWRNKNPEVIPDLMDFNFTKYKTNKQILPNTSGGDSWIEGHWDYNSINFINVNLSNSRLCNSILSRKHIVKSDFSGADFTESVLNDVLLKHSNFNRAVLNGVNLKGATIVESNFVDAIISDSHIFGISSWGRELTLEGSIQSNLIITKEEEDVITVDNMQDANFIYNLYNNKTAGAIINSVSQKLVFILGNFSPERKIILDKLKEKLRTYNLVPLVFDFQRPKNRNLKETVLLIANLSKFIIVDLTDGRSVQRELEIIVPHLASVIIQPIILKSQKIYGMLDDILELSQVLPIFEYNNINHLLNSLKTVVIDQVVERMNQLQILRNNR